MTYLAIDLGGTKLASSLFDESGNIIYSDRSDIKGRKGNEVGKFITGKIRSLLNSSQSGAGGIKSIGISVPGISNMKTGFIWAPNIPGWIDYPLLQEVKEVVKEIPVVIDSDRACSILGEVWQGNARGCRDAIFLAVGTGIGAGILINGEVLRGSHDIAGAVGWLALNRPFAERYMTCGCFEYHASGEGIAKVAMNFVAEETDYKGPLKPGHDKVLTSYDVFMAYKDKDPIAVRVIEQSIEFWGMAVANLITIFNPEKIIFGGGIFGPAAPLIPAIAREAGKWAQPVSFRQVKMEISGLGGDAAIFGAGYHAINVLNMI